MRANLNPPIREQLTQYLKNPFVPERPSQPFSARLGGDRPAHRPDAAAGRHRDGPRDHLRRVAGCSQRLERGGRFDKTATTSTLVLYSMPEFWFGMILLIVFSVECPGSQGSSRSAVCRRRGSTVASSAGRLDLAWHLVLPVLTLTVIYLAEYSLIMRASIIDESRQDYLQTARAKGLLDSTCAAGMRSQRPAPDDDADLSEPRLRHRRRDHHRVRVLASTVSAP